jgi:hypothetical protein
MAEQDSTFFLVNVTSASGPKKYAKISPQDAPLVLLQKWRATATKRIGNRSVNHYAVACYVENGVKYNVKMHRLIMNPPEGMHVDHINGDGLDNRRENLRIVTPQQNCANSRKTIMGQSRFKGVAWCAGANKWRAYIAVDRKQQHLGLFADEIAAAEAYDKRAKEVWGEYARLNLT